jgi:hypothetical protein
VDTVRFYLTSWISTLPVTTICQQTLNGPRCLDSECWYLSDDYKLQAVNFHLDHHRAPIRPITWQVTNRVYVSPGVGWISNEDGYECILKKWVGDTLRKSWEDIPDFEDGDVVPGRTKLIIYGGLNQINMNFAYLAKRNGRGYGKEWTAERINAVQNKFEEQMAPKGENFEALAREDVMDSIEEATDLHSMSILEFRKADEAPACECCGRTCYQGDD